MIALGDCRQPVTGLILVAVQPQAVFSDNFGRNVGGFDVFGKFDEPFQVQLIVLGCFCRATAFDFKAFDVIKDQLGNVHAYSIQW